MIVDALIRHAAGAPLLVAIQIFEQTEVTSLAEVQSRFEWSSRRVYGLNVEGQNHDLLLGGLGWSAPPPM